jgi:predicted RNA-binding protein YlxR (DUF448 family)
MPQRNTEARKGCGLVRCLRQSLPREHVVPQRIRKVSVRTCVVCQQSSGKKGLVRIIRTPAGPVEMDPTGKRSGRGAYICSRPECRTDPHAAQRLSRALKAPVTPQMLCGWLSGEDDANA